MVQCSQSHSKSNFSRDGTFKKPKTSRIHPGPGEKGETLTGAIGRQRKRIVVNSKVDSLGKRTSVAQLLEAAYDVVQGESTRFSYHGIEPTRSHCKAHRVLVNEKRVLHWDISPNNISINHIRDYECEFKESKSAKYIEQVLNPDK